MTERTYEQINNVLNANCANIEVVSEMPPERQPKRKRAGDLVEDEEDVLVVLPPRRAKQPKNAYVLNQGEEETGSTYEEEGEVATSRMKTRASSEPRRKRSHRHVTESTRSFGDSTTDALPDVPRGALAAVPDRKTYTDRNLSAVAKVKTFMQT